MKKKNSLISIVTPVFQTEKSLKNLYERVKTTLQKVKCDFEIILVDDASPDNSWEVIKDLAKQNKRIKGIRFSRNFGQHCAITAGIDEAKGDWIVVMDSDLQDLPEEILKLYTKATEGYDIVLGKRSFRGDPFYKKIASNVFYRLFNFLSDVKKDPDTAFFVIFNKKVKESLCRFRESSRFIPSILDWSGFKKSYVNVSHVTRKEGKSSYTFLKLALLATNAIISHSNRPLKIIISVGLVISTFSGLLIFYFLYLHFINGISTSGWASLIISVWFSSGIIMTLLGIIGLYIGNIYEQVKNRPLYIIQDKTF